MPEQAVSYRNHSSTAKPIKPRYQTVKVGAPPGTGQTCSCMDLVLMEFGFSLRGIHCRNSLYIFNSPLPVCVALCLPEQLATAGVSRVMDTYVQSWVSQRPSEQPWCDFCFSSLQDSLGGAGVCYPVHSWRFVSQLFRKSYFSGGRGHRKT